MPDSETRAAASEPLEHVLLDVGGMHCASCSSRVEGILARLDGVASARVSLVGGQASVEFDPRRITLQQMAAAVAEGGYTAGTVADAEDLGTRLAEKEARESAAWRRRFLLAIALLAPLVWLTYFSRLAPPALAWWQFLLATPLQLFVGWPYLAGAWSQAKHAAANMDTLVALGTSTAYVAGLVQFAQVLAGTPAAPSLAHGAMYFLDAGMILTFITLGKYLEVKAKGRASEAIRKLSALAPPEAIVLRRDKPTTVAIRAVMVGETILVRPGDRVPLDAEVVSGTSSVDQSWLTGESIPVEKSPGETILAGTINGQGALTARVTRASRDTALAQVVELVRKAQESKPQVGRLADRVVSWFVPAVLAAAAITLAAWGLAGDWSMGLSCTVAVLVVACPCALGLATPTAVLVAGGRGAEQGILIKDARALEIAGRLTTIVFDKTGTITEGRPRVATLLPAQGVGEDELLATAAAAERLSQHPLAAAIVEEADSRRLAVPTADDLTVIPGQGVRASAGGETILVGNEKLLDGQGLDTAAWNRPLAEAREKGLRPLLVARDGQTLGLVAVGDPVAPHSREAIARLKATGLDVRLLSGDHHTAARAVAAEVGIEHVDAEVLPDEKQSVVRALQDRGQIVAMVGDGINDAPALAAADLGIAVGSGADVAIESADLVLVGEDLRAVGRAIRLSRVALRTIWQNLGWALFYNVLLIPLAAGALVPWLGIRMPPAAAACAMAASSVSVVSNSLLLRRRRLE